MGRIARNRPVFKILISRILRQTHLKGYELVSAEESMQPHYRHWQTSPSGAFHLQPTIDIPHSFAFSSVRATASKLVVSVGTYERLQGYGIQHLLGALVQNTHPSLTFYKRSLCAPHHINPVHQQPFVAQLGATSSSGLTII